jgi:hypothetical protein
MNAVANAIANVIAKAVANTAPVATHLLQQTGYLHIQSILPDAFQGKVKSEKRYLPSALGAFPIDDSAVDFATKCARDNLTKPHDRRYP